MKKVLSVLLCVLLLLPTGIAAAFAEDTGSPQPEDEGGIAMAEGLESAFAEDENSLIVFVTGIGQSFSYLFDESYTADGAFEHGTLQDYENYAPLIAEGKYKARWNLFVNDFSEALDDRDTKKTIFNLVNQLLFTLFLRRNMVKEDDLRNLVKSLFSFNYVDENGCNSNRVVTPRYTCPVSEYPGVTDENGNFESEAKNRFYRSIPCADVAREKLGENYEDYLYCYNYNAFSYTSKNIEGLHDYIETVIANNRVGATKVVLIPMSMGASVVSSYLAKYPDAADNHVRRVVSIVGCWKGSELIYELLTRSYADNSADLFYNGIIADLVGEPWGYVVNMALRLFSKQSLRDLVDEALSVFTGELIVKTPSLVSLVPDGTYDEIRPMIKSEAVLRETDFYQQAQQSLEQRFAALKEQGIGLSFISGYGLPYGAITSDYKAFGFMHSAATTNSDEIINVASTAPGTQYTAYDKAFEDTAGRELSPDGSLDISGTYFKDSSWFFRRQKHELEFNNTAIRLAIELALGTVKTVADCSDKNAQPYYPQFNDARNIEALTRDYIPALEKYLEDGGTLNAEQTALYERVKAMLKSTVNDFDADNKLIEEFANMLVDIGVKDAPQKQSRFKSAFNTVLGQQNDVVNKIFGSKGYLDF